MTSLTIKQAVQAVKVGYLANVPVLLTGGPRIGKTTSTEIAAAEIAKDMGLEFINYHTDKVDFLDENDREEWWNARDPEKTFGYRRIPVPLWDLGLTMGIPMPREGSNQMRFLRPAFIPDKGKGLLVLDELTQADKATQKGFLGLLWERQAGDHRMAPGWGLAATGNRLTDRAGVEQLISPIRGRLDILQVDPDLDEWLEWHHKTGRNALVRTYLKWRGATGLQLAIGGGKKKKQEEGEKAATENVNVFYGFDPAASSQSFPSPGSWDMVGRVLDTNSLPINLELPVLSGMLGDGVTADFMGFVRTYKDLPSMDVVRRDPKKAPVPDSMSGKYAMMLHIAQSAKIPEDGQVIYDYLDDRVGADLQTVCFMELIHKHGNGKFANMPVFGKWIVKHGKLLGVTS